MPAGGRWISGSRSPRTSFATRPRPASAVDLKALNAERECRTAVLANGRAKAQLVAARKEGEAIKLAVR
jgi:hypothetical protein